MILDQQLSKILLKFNIVPKNRNLHYYIQAFTHPSYVNEQSEILNHYQRLEFLGDTVLQMAITDLIFKTTTLSEGNMSFLRQKLVKEDTLAKISLELGLDKIILLGLGENRNRPSLLGDIFEALVGAIYLDQGLDVVMFVISELFLPTIKDVQNDVSKIRDPKSLLLEYSQMEKRDSVVFKTIADNLLPNNLHEFEVEVRIDNVIYGKGKGQNIKEAEQNAAQDALNKIAPFKKERR